MNTTINEPARFASMSRETARAKRIRDAYAIERCIGPRHHVVSRVLYVLALLLLVAAAIVFSSGPSDTEAMQDVAADLADAQATALLTAQGRAK